MDRITKMNYYANNLKTMNDKDLELATYEIRDFLVEKVSATGGHLASNLGVVELTIALHKMFDSPKDKLIWDVGHQSYVHKILTGRAAGFDSLRQIDGLSGFPNHDESPHDYFGTGHASNSISAAAGMAAARDLADEKYNVVAVIGDGSLVGGMAYEALNNSGASKNKMIVVLNDNAMSISDTTGSISHYLSRLRTSSGYLELKKKIKKQLRKIPNVGDDITIGIEHIKDTLKYAIMDGVVFEELGFTYLGPIDGHDISLICETLALAKRVDGPVIVHVLTQKGKGYKAAEEDPNKFHGISASNEKYTTPPNSKSYSQILGDTMCELAASNPKLVAVCAAMSDGTGLTGFAKAYPNRFFDVGIAEEHAVTFAAGMAQAGYTPVVAIYSTFLQRGYDQIITDVCMQNLPVIFAVDRAGLVGNDGRSHHGIFDISYLSSIPNLTLLSPRNGIEFIVMIKYAIALQKPVAIRYPRGCTTVESEGKMPEFSGKSRLLSVGTDCEIWAVGKMTDYAVRTGDLLKENGYSVGVVDVAQIKPLDMELLLTAPQRTDLIITVEDNILEGGFGQNLCSIVSSNNLNVKVKSICCPSGFIEHGDTEDLFRKYKLDENGLLERVSEFIEGKA